MASGQEHWTGPTLLPHSSCNPKLSHIPSRDLCTPLSSGDGPFLASRSADWLLAATWTQEQTYKGTPAVLGDRGSQIGIPSLPFPSEEEMGAGGGGSPFTDEHISKARDSGIF